MKSSGDVEILSTLNNHLTANILKYIKHTDGNLIFSPLSVHITASLLETLTLEWNGVSNKSKDIQFSYNDLIPYLQKSNVELLIGSKIFMQNTYDLLFDKIKNVANNVYYTETQMINFNNNRNAAKIINKWTANKTNGKITDLIDPTSISGLTTAVIVNAIYFKSNWKIHFNKKLTKKHDFFVSEKQKISVDTMQVTSSFEYEEMDELNATIIKLPYENNAYNFILVLPYEKESISKIENGIFSKFDSLVDFSGYKRKIKLSIPKFKFSKAVNLKKAFHHVNQFFFSIHHSRVD